ncbi:MAG: lysostaphin resistance A-like protein [Carbonactinosporaceae bacterium]
MVAPFADSHLLDLARRARRRPAVTLVTAVSIVLPFVAALAGAAAYAAAPAAAVLPSTRDHSPLVSATARLLVLLLSFGVMSLLAWLWVARVEQRPFRTLGFERSAGGPALRGLLLGLTMFAAVAAVLAVLGLATTTGRPADPAVLAAVGATCVGWAVQGSAEEIVFRGMLLQSVALRFGAGAGVAVSAVVFTLLHVLNPGFTVLAALNLFLVGVFLGRYALRAGSLWGVCAWHAAWNWAQANVLGYSVSGLGADRATGRITIIDVTETGPDWLTGGAFGPEAGLVTTAVLACGIAVQWVRKPPGGRLAG